MAKSYMTKKRPGPGDAPANVSTTRELVPAEVASGEVVPVEFANPPPLFDSLYVNNAIKHKIVKALAWFDARMESGEANAKDMDVMLKYLIFAQEMGASQATDPLEKFRALGREVTRSVTVKETVVEST